MKIYNTMSRRKEELVPMDPSELKMYVCGPTVYGDAHLGHARPGVTYDVLFRLLGQLGYSLTIAWAVTKKRQQSAGITVVVDVRCAASLRVAASVSQLYTSSLQHGPECLRDCMPKLLLTNTVCNTGEVFRPVAVGGVRLTYTVLKHCFLEKVLVVIADIPKVRSQLEQAQMTASDGRLAAVLL